jgi:predicted DNA-binding transcriptional regulator YafY
LNDCEVLAYFLLEETAKSLAGTPVQEYLSSALQKFSVMLPVGDSLTLPDLMNSMSLRLERAPAIATQPIVLTQLCQAIASRRRLEIEYNSHSRTERTCRRIDPLHLTRCEGQWYLVAYCHLRNEIRTFVPARINSITELKEHFDPPKDFNAAEHFKKAFGIMVKENVEEVSLLFLPDVAPYVSERNWHPTQSIEKLSDGQIRLNFTCSHSQELIRWLLSWGASVRIEKPFLLRQIVHNSHNAASKTSIISSDKN